MLSKSKRSIDENQSQLNKFSLLEIFSIIYDEILDYFKNNDEIIVVDYGQFYCMKDLSNLKLNIIVIKTSIENFYNRKRQYKKE